MSAMSQADQLREKVLELQQALLSSNPMMPQLLRHIHTQLRMEPELVTMLAPEEIGTICQGMQKQTMSVIATAAAKSKTKKATQLTLEDL